MTRGTDEFGWRPKGIASPYAGPVVDCDIHHGWPERESFLKYMSGAWQEYIRGPMDPMRLFLPGEFPHPHGFRRPETVGSDGVSLGARLETLRPKLLDSLNIRRGVLNFDEGLFGISGIRNPYLAAALASAANDYTKAEWLDHDKRLVASVLVSPQIPELAAEEIRRVGGNDQIVQVIFGGTSLDKPLGHPIYHPIYQAAEEMGLTIGIHIGSNGGMNPDSTAGGKVSLYAEMHPLWAQSIQTHATSFIMHGVFEKFPKLKLVLLEAGISWVPGWLWRLDCDFKSLQREVPWLKRLPSEYFRDHISLTTQPMEISPNRQHLIDLISMFEGQKCFMFSTDFPHWDGDDVSFIASRIPREWWSDIFAGNAARLYGFKDVISEIEAGGLNGSKP